MNNSIVELVVSMAESFVNLSELNVCRGLFVNLFYQAVFLL